LINPKLIWGDVSIINGTTLEELARQDEVRTLDIQSRAAAFRPCVDILAGSLGAFGIPVERESRGVFTAIQWRRGLSEISRAFPSEFNGQETEPEEHLSMSEKDTISSLHPDRRRQSSPHPGRERQQRQIPVWTLFLREHACRLMAAPQAHCHNDGRLMMRSSSWMNPP
jgi:hypothetical protein